MRRRQLIVALLATPLIGRAQQRPRLYRIAVLSIGSDPRVPLNAPNSRWRFFVEAMRELDRVEGRDFELRSYFGDGIAANLPALVADLKRAAPDIVLTTGDREVIALRDAGVNSTPIVFTFVPDPLRRGFVKSLAKPGGNITGISTFVPGQPAKMVELLHEAVPSARRLAVVGAVTNTAPEFMYQYEEAARSLGLLVTPAPVTDRASYEAVFDRARQDGVQAIIAPMDGETSRFRDEFTQIAIKNRLPGIYGERMYAEAGGFISYSSNFGDRLRRAAIMMDKIMKGASPGDLPVEQPTKYEIVVNLRTARALGIEVPRSILLRADQVIE